jgi:SAM-dependent methyltransferase
MLNTTVARLRCPHLKKGAKICASPLQVFSDHTPLATASAVTEISSGHLQCLSCKSSFPILAGVAILVDDVHGYLLGHVKGICQLVPDAAIPAEFRDNYLEAKNEIVPEHIEEDLESSRVTALYLMNHYLRVKNVKSPSENFWQAKGESSPLIDSLVKEHWDTGPFAQIAKWVQKMTGAKKKFTAVELGCGVGGLYRELQPNLSSYLGVDSSFASIALARHFNLGIPYAGKIEIPGDLLQGALARAVKIPVATAFDGSVDFVLADLENLPLEPAYWDLSLVLNAIDMLEEPAALPRLQFSLLKANGVAIQSCPYVWHALIAKKLRKLLPKTIQDSASAVEWLYEKAGFTIEQKVNHLPWLFFKHVRQIELYSVHLLFARKP